MKSTAPKIRAMKPRAFTTLMVAAIALSACQPSPETRLEVVLNPYQEVDWSVSDRQKANFHTHTTQSDGHYVPHKVVDMYHEQGYSVLALTDHDHVTWPWTEFTSMEASELAWERYQRGDIERPDGYENRDPEMLGMFGPPGNELSRNHHTISLFSEFEAPLEDLHGVLDDMAEFSSQGLAMLAHPTMHWPSWFAPQVGASIPLNPELREVTLGDFTIESWFRTQDTGRNILMGNGGSSDGVLNLELHNDNHIRVYVDPANDDVEGVETTDLSIDPGVPVTDGEWHHLAAVRRGADVILYLNGEEAARTEDTAGAYELLAESFFLGQDHRGGDLAFHGDLDDMRLWGRALSTQELSMQAEGRVPQNRENLLLEFLFEEDQPSEGDHVYMDTGESLSGPNHASNSDEYGPRLTETVAPAIQESSSKALSVKPVEWERVPDNALDMYLDLYQRHRNLVAMEVHNGTRPLDEHPLDKNLWDRLLSTMMPERPVWGTATDDMHEMHHFAGDWVEFPRANNEPEQLRQAFLDGAFYFSSVSVYNGEQPSEDLTPEIVEVDVQADSGIIRVKATENGQPMGEDAYVWVSMEDVVHTGPELDLSTLETDATYVRAEIYGRGGTTYTQPFGLRQVDIE